MKRIILVIQNLTLILALALFTFSFEATADINTDITAPSVPSGIVLTPASPSQINLSWSSSTDDDTGVYGYNVFRNGSSVATSSATSYSDMGLNASTTYEYMISAFDLANNTSAASATFTATTLAATSTPSSTTTPDTTAPSTPTGLTASSTSQSQIDVSWNASSDNVGVSGYVLFRNGSQIATPSSTAYSDMNLSTSTGYTYMVSAFDVAGNVSGLSSMVSATTTASTSSTTTPPTTSTTTPATTTPPSVTPPTNLPSGIFGFILIPSSLFNQMMNGTSTPGSSTTTAYTMINGYPTMNGNYFDCEGNIDNDMAHHTTDVNDTDPGHNVGKNCPGGMPKMPKMNMDMNQMFMPGMMNHPMFGMWNGNMTEDWVVVPLTADFLMKMADMMNM